MNHFRLPGISRVNKKLNIYRSKKCREVFDSYLEKYTLLLNSKRISLVLYSFSGLSTYQDQMLSLISFLNNVGIPKSWIIFSDGSYSEDHIRKLKKFPFVEVKKYNVFDNNHEEISWMEKKFRAYSSVVINGTSIFLDSDILFHNGFNESIVQALGQNNWYLSDLSAHFDDYYFSNYSNDFNKMNFINSGFFVLNSNIDWDMGKQYLARLKKEEIPLGHFSEQTAMEIVFKSNNLRFLDPRIFLLTMDDHFTLNSNVDYSQIAIRHYVGPIRFRMWLVAKKYNFFDKS